MSLEEEIPAFSIWETFHETIPALMSLKPAGAEHLTKILKSGDFCNIFVYTRDPSVADGDYRKIATKYKAFTTWFLGRFFYLLSCKRLSRNHNVFVDIQLCVLDQLAHSQLNVYNEMVKEYCTAFNTLIKFVKCRGENVTLHVFIPTREADLCRRLSLEPLFAEVSLKNCEEFLVSFLKIMGHIVQLESSYHNNQILEDCLYLLSEGSFVIKLAILKIYLEISSKEDPILQRYSQYFEQIVYSVYSKKFPVVPKQLEQFEALVTTFLELNLHSRMFFTITEFLLMGAPDPCPSPALIKFCKKQRLDSMYQSADTLDTKALLSYNTSVLCGLRKNLTADVGKMKGAQEGAADLKAWKCGYWKSFYGALVQSMDSSNCTKACRAVPFVEFMGKLTVILLQVRLETNLKIVFFEDSFLIKVLSVMNRHFSGCGNNVDFGLIYEVLLNLAFCSSRLSTVFEVFAYVFTSRLPFSQFGGPADYGRYKKELQDFCSASVRLIGDPEVALVYIVRFLTGIASGSFEVPPIHDLEITYFSIVKRLQSQHHIANLSHFLTLFHDTDRLVSDVLIPALSSDDGPTKREVTRAVPEIICLASSDFVKVARIDPETNQFSVAIYCEKCHISKGFGVSFARVDLDLSAVTGNALTSVLKFLTVSDPQLKILALEALPPISNHVLKFYSSSVSRIWVEKCGDPEESVRTKCGEVVAKILKASQENALLSEKQKVEMVTIVCDQLLRLTKTSLQETDVQLQETILATIHEVSTVMCDELILPIVKILIYLVMVPTSRHRLLAVDRFVHFARTRNVRPNQLYKHYRKELCELIAHLCVVNHSLVDYSLATSLCKIAPTLEFSSAKDFISKECPNLLPFFIVKIIKAPAIGALLEEMALMVNMPLPDLLISVYGNIFLHVFLDEPQDTFKLCSSYLQRITKQSASSLRKRNLWVILNELLLNFHDKKDKVLQALKQLASEDNDATVEVRDYLQSKLLGLLQHFDFKLMAKNSNRKSSILLSLADFLRYMGPTYVAPVRFKVIAMLQTVDYNDFPERNCGVWEAFIKSCDVESLAPHLATIFVSVLPLVKSCPRQINDIFKYLVVTSETQTKDFIKDLFFVDDEKVDPLVKQTIRKHLRSFSNYSFKEKIITYVKYLTHETIEVRIRALKQLKALLEKNREGLDRMILGYNGIDPLVVELIEILTRGCREKEPSLKLACGEVIGELGAVEPSHLPRRYAQNRNFSFFMSDDAFVVNCLNELCKALQGEKNTVNMDRLALAIQELLKNYKISSDSNSAKHDLWKQFSEAQQALMVPLLTSRYMVSQPKKVNLPVPIYGSSKGGLFQDWLYNWTQSLISTLPQEHGSKLHPCLPAMKLDNRILMLFLPYIVLHSILSDVSDNREKMYLEMKTVTGSFDKKDVDSLLLPDDNSSSKLPEKIERNQCTKIVFIILDFLDRWTREWQWTQGFKGRSEQNFLAKISGFLERFCKLELAKCNYYCGEYPRALMYLEDYIAWKPHDVGAQLTLLTKIYAQLDEPDGVFGVTALQQTEPPIEQRILSLEVSGKLSDAAACYERLPQPLKMYHLKGLTQCYLDLDNVNTALNFSQGALDRQPEFGNMLLELQAEPLWRLGRYDELDVLLKRPELENNSSWGVQIGKTLLAFQNRDRKVFDELVQSLKSQQVDLLGAASVEDGAYQHGYCYISRLHALNELQQVERVTFDILSRRDDDFVVKTIQNLTKEWELRIKVVQESGRIVEPLLCLRRVAVEQSKRLIEGAVPRAVPHLNSLLGECWLYSAQTARSAGVPQQSYTYTLKAEEYNPPSLFVEKSKLHWLREEHEQALTTLRRGLEILLPDRSKEALEALSLEKRKICAEAKLLIATYNDSMSNVDTDIKKTNYREASEMYKEWEVGFVSLAQFYDRHCFQTLADEERDDKGDLQILMINYFCKSLRYGTAYVYQSMPRLLSLWFDYGTRLLRVTEVRKRDERKNKLFQMTKLIDNALETLPAYVFYTAFSQIISRICHPQREVYMELKTIIIKLLLQYPQQSLWMMICVMKSANKVRSQRCAEIFLDHKLKTSNMSKLIKDFTSLSEKLIELCDKKIAADVETTTVSALLRTLPRMLNKGDFSEIMIPTHKFRKLVLPNPDFASSEHNPFPNHYIHIAGIDEEITIIRSLQRPRKITLLGSDGKRYIQMLKPKDDLRRDFRLMEFNDIVNQLLSREPESRQRRLNIRLYSVSPLNEECGLIEWVPKLVGLRPVLQTIYKLKGLGMNIREVRDSSCNIRDSLAKKREIFTNKFLARHPPVLGEWFRRTFPDAQSWFFARTAYIRTTAVVSMVGYILGLGDRHGENILFDSTSGDTVHVDFNCLFNKGETFEWPERVPFRLTQNMVAAMGPLGVEGVFRKSCACTLRVLRTNVNTLMSIVTPFVYDDHLVAKQGQGQEPPAERTNEQAVEHVKNIELRLKGIMKTKDRSHSIPLSVDGQTNSLINTAMDVDNLCQMYIGWGPYL